MHDDDSLNTKIIAFPSISNNICCGNDTLYIDYNGNVFVCGRNVDCRLAFETEGVCIYPIQQIKSLTNIKMISCGELHTVCCDIEGNVFSFGSNNSGRLGIGKREDKLKYTHIPQKLNIPPCNIVQCGDYFTVCLTYENTVYSFGNGGYGQLGHGNHNNCIIPTKIEDLYDIEAIECGGNFVFCKTFTEYYCWGYNREGQLGFTHSETLLRPTKCTSIPKDIVSIKCGYAHTLLLTAFGYVYSSGQNDSTQSGIENCNRIKGFQRIKALPLIQNIYTKEDSSLCIDIDNKLWVFGANRDGVLGLGNTKIANKPMLNTLLPPIIDVAIGYTHTLLKTINNEIYGCGINSYSELGLENTFKKYKEPIQIFKDEDIWFSNIKSRAKSARK